MRRRRLLLLTLFLVPTGLLGLGLGATCASRRPVEAQLEGGRLRPCPGTPNCVSSEVGEADVEPFTFTGDADAAFESLVAFLEAEPRVEVLARSGDHVHAVAKTALLRFADDLELRLDRERGVIHVRSASRIGISDLGANRARVESIRARWEPPSTP